MNLRQQEAEADALAAQVAHDRLEAASARSRLRVLVARTARQPATLAWAFAAGTIVGAREGGNGSSFLARLSAALRISVSTWSKVRLLGALAQGRG